MMLKQTIEVVGSDVPGYSGQSECKFGHSPPTFAMSQWHLLTVLKGTISSGAVIQLTAAVEVASMTRANSVTAVACAWHCGGG